MHARDFVLDPPIKGNGNKSSFSDEKGKGKGNRKGTSGHAASDTEVSSCQCVLLRVCLKEFVLMCLCVIAG